jgi:hypothetical protein
LEELEPQLLNEEMQIKLDIEKKTSNDPLIAQSKVGTNCKNIKSIKKKPRRP